MLLGHRGGFNEATVEGVLRVVVCYDYFGQFLSPQWNTGKLSADSAESSTQDPFGFFVVVVFVSTEAAAAQQREQNNQQKGDQAPGCNHTHPLVGLEIAGTRHRIAVLVMAGADLVAVDSVLAGLTGHIAVCAIKPGVTQALSGNNMTDAIKTMAAVVFTVLTIRAVGAAHLTPVPNPARVTVRTLAMNGVTVVTIFTRRAHFLAVFTKEALGAELITPSPIPSSVTCDTAAPSHLAGLLAFAVPTPVSAVLTIEPSRTWLPAELPTVPRQTGT